MMHAAECILGGQVHRIRWRKSHPVHSFPEPQVERQMALDRSLQLGELLIAQVVAVHARKVTFRPAREKMGGGEVCSTINDLTR